MRKNNLSDRHYFIIAAWILFMLKLSVPCQLQAEDSIPKINTDYIWYHPPVVAAASSCLLIGASPLISETMQKGNILVRENVQLFRRNALDHKQLHFDNQLQLVSFVSLTCLKWAGVPAKHSTIGLLCRTATAAATITAFTVPTKHFVTEWRPDRSATNSFPSGHTAFAFAGAEMLRLEYSDYSVWIPVVGYSIAVLTGFMRIYNDRHWTSDVLAGATIGMVSADIAYLLNERFVDPILLKIKNKFQKRNLPVSPYTDLSL